MSHPNRTLYLPYGAYELKATYQRNLLIGMISTTSFVAIVLLGGWLFLGAADPVITIHPVVDRNEVEIDLRTQYTITQPEPVVGRSLTQPPSHPVKPPDVVVPAGLNPVDDDLFDDETPRLASNDQRAALVDGVLDDENLEFLEGAATGVFAGGDGTDYLPLRTDFVAVEMQPELIHSPQPRYPRSSRAVGDEGAVIIQALVSKTGDVLDVAVAKSSGFELLDEAALEVAWKYKYRPAIQNHVPIAVWVSYKVEFKLAR